MQPANARAAKADAVFFDDLRQVDGDVLAGSPARRYPGLVRRRKFETVRIADQQDLVGVAQRLPQLADLLYSADSGALDDDPRHFALLDPLSELTS